MISKPEFYKQKTGSILDHYEVIGSKIGSGHFGTVSKAKLKGSKSIRAIKRIPKHKVKNSEQFRNQVRIMQKLDHPNVIKLYQIFQDEQYLYMVMQLCSGGQLFDRLVSRKFNQKEARQIIHQVLQAVNYCHQNSIVHRDIKPQNILFLNKGDDSPIKLIDFGLSRFTDKEIKIPVAGSLHYVSPQVLQGTVSFESDTWSIGVLTFVTLSGKQPFVGDDQQQITDAIKCVDFSLGKLQQSGCSSQALQFVKSILIKDAKKRLKIQEALQHPWFKETLKHDFLKFDLQAFRTFSSFNSLKKMAISVLASQLNGDQVKELSQTFKKLDKIGNGMLTLQQIRDGLSSTNPQLTNLFQAVDTDQNGKISYNQFIAATMSKVIYMEQQNLLQAFRMLDVDNSGKISKTELSTWLKKGRESRANQIVKKFDTDGDQEISYSQFLKLMTL